MYGCVCFCSLFNYCNASRIHTIVDNLKRHPNVILVVVDNKCMNRGCFRCRNQYLCIKMCTRMSIINMLYVHFNEYHSQRIAK